MRERERQKSGSAQGPIYHHPLLDVASELGGPIFFRCGHEHLSSRLVCLLQQRQESTAPFYVKLTHDVVDEQHGRDAGPAAQILGLPHFEGDREGALLAFTAELSSRSEERR